MLELTEGEAHVAVKSAKHGDKFLVRGETVVFVQNERRPQWFALVFNNDKCVSWNGVNMFTRRELQGLLMSDLFELC